jgi:hypothetical protein
MASTRSESVGAPPGPLAAEPKSWMTGVAAEIGGHRVEAERVGVEPEIDQHRAAGGKFGEPGDVDAEPGCRGGRGRGPSPHRSRCP